VSFTFVALCRHTKSNKTNNAKKKYKKYKKKMSNRKVWSKNSSIPHSITQIITKQQRIENNQKIKRKINDLNNNYVHLKSMCMHDECDQVMMWNPN